jgi:hypothetical protein
MCIKLFSKFVIFDFLSLSCLYLYEQWTEWGRLGLRFELQSEEVHSICSSLNTVRINQVNMTMTGGACSKHGQNNPCKI